jgi:3-phenylpropionate/trans-cinnamate dioxygenase ferredoxin reductase subunit
MNDDVVIVGGGLAAVRSAQMLRDIEYGGAIRLICGETRLPYDRPPLSKEYLLGESSDADVELLSETRLNELGVELSLGTPACRLDRRHQRVELEDGSDVPYGRLVIATGARANRMQAIERFEGVAYLRTLDDSARLRDELGRRPRVGIVGGGFIGLEVASVARRLGCEVTVIEMAPEPLAPILGDELGAYIRSWHEEHGVRFRRGAAITGARGNGRVEELVLADASVVPIDLAVVGVGVTPNVEWLADSGLELHRGLVTDEHCRTSDPLIYGAGDVSCRHVDGRCTPCGHWTAASDHAAVVAGALTGEADSPPVQDGYFWSDQFGVRLQFAGNVSGRPELTIASGTFEERRFVAVLGSTQETTAVFGMASPREFIRTSVAALR